MTTYEIYALPATGPIRFIQSTESEVAGLTLRRARAEARKADWWDGRILAVVEGDEADADSVRNRAITSARKAGAPLDMMTRDDYRDYDDPYWASLVGSQILTAEPREIEPS